MKKEKGKHNYCFPNAMATIMSKIDQRTQYEATMLSLVFILGGLIVTGVFTIGFTDLRVFSKVLIGVNIVAGMIFLSSSLVTTYQQYVSYLGALELYDSDGKINLKGVE